VIGSPNEEANAALRILAYYADFIFRSLTSRQAEVVRELLKEHTQTEVAKKLKKSQAWQGVCLDLGHSVKIEKNNLFLLDGTTDDEIGPCIGRFFGGISQWMSFIDSEFAEDTENIGLVLKKMKRQIKRAFPELSEAIIKERIFVTPPLSGADLKLSANGTLPKVGNLWIASSQLSAYKNILGSLAQAQFILSSLGFMPVQNIIEPAINSEIEFIDDAEATVLNSSPSYDQELPE
jgi:hypothetical protein